MAIKVAVITHQGDIMAISYKINQCHYKPVVFHNNINFTIMSKYNNCKYQLVRTLTGKGKGKGTSFTGDEPRPLEFGDSLYYPDDTIT